MPIRDRVVQPNGFASLTAEAFVSLVVAGDHVTSAADAVCARYGITGVQYNALRILRGAHPDGHPRCDVSRRLMRAAPDVTRMLDRLVRRGLVRRARGAEDRRLSVARITEKGLALLGQMQPEMDAAVAEALSPLNETQLRQLVRLCEELVP